MEAVMRTCPRCDFSRAESEFLYRRGSTEYARRCNSWGNARIRERHAEVARNPMGSRSLSWPKTDWELENCTFVQQMRGAGKSTKSASGALCEVEAAKGKQ